MYNCYKTIKHVGKKYTEVKNILIPVAVKSKA